MIVSLRLPVPAATPGPFATIEAENRLRHSADMLGLRLASFVTVQWTAVDDNGVHSMSDRWLVASAHAVEDPNA